MPRLLAIALIGAVAQTLGCSSSSTNPSSGGSSGSDASLGGFAGKAAGGGSSGLGGTNGGSSGGGGTSGGTAGLGGSTGDTCAPTSQTYKRVFVTSKSYQGDFGLNSPSVYAKAATECQALADAACLGGTYEAWLSVGATEPINEFTPTNMPYALVNGPDVASSWPNLISGTLLHQIDTDEYGAPYIGEPFAWTFTNAYGTQGGFHCNDWTSSAETNQGTVGDVTLKTEAWSNDQPKNCNESYHLYCFEQ